MAGIIQQAPTMNQDWSINWATRGLGADLIVSSSWVITVAPDSALVLATPTFTGTTTTIWVTGGTAGKRYAITNTIVTTGGQEIVESLIVNIVFPQQILI